MSEYFGGKSAAFKVEPYHGAQFALALLPATVAVLTCVVTVPAGVAVPAKVKSNTPRNSAPRAYLRKHFQRLCIDRRNKQDDVHAACLTHWGIRRSRRQTALGNVILHELGTAEVGVWRLKKAWHRMRAALLALCY